MPHKGSVKNSLFSGATIFAPRCSNRPYIRIGWAVTLDLRQKLLLFGFRQLCPQVQHFFERRQSPLVLARSLVATWGGQLFTRLNREVKILPFGQSGHSGWTDHTHLASPLPLGC